LVAVSKTFPPQAIAEAYAAGQQAFAENYAQEAIEKIATLLELLRRRNASPERPLLWHYIGPIQSNKTRAVAENFDWVHGIDRAKIAERLSLSRPDDKALLQVCIQVNVSGEASKNGVAPEAVFGLAQTIMRLPRVRLRGLMAIPEPTPDTALQRGRFRMLREIRDDLLRRGVALDTLSMGMSEDLEAAIAEGATLVRVGRAIFGERGSGAG
jgi:PLP dependent protein